MFKNFFLVIFLFYIAKFIFKSVIFEGLSKFSIDDIQSITSVDILAKIWKLMILIKY